MKHDRVIPLVFEENRGQWPEDVTFVGRTSHYAVAVKGNELRFALPVPSDAKQQDITLSLEASRPVVPSGRSQAGFLTNYYIGNDPAKYRTGVRNFEQISLDGIYPGVHEVLYAQNSTIEHDFVVDAHADPSLIEIGVHAAQPARLDKDGELVIPSRNGDLLLRKPHAYQIEAKGQHTPVRVNFVLEAQGDLQSVRFRLGKYDPTRQLVIDPVIVYASYAGGKSGSTASAIASDTAGNVYLAGSTTSAAADFGVTNTVTNFSTGTTTANPAAAAFVARFSTSAAGSAVSWLSYFGSAAGSSQPTAVALQGASTGNVIVGGQTAAPDFPGTTSTFQPAARGTGQHGFIALLATATGNLGASTYVDGAATAESAASTTVAAITSDGSGNVVVGGTTNGGGLPTTPSALPVPNQVTTSGNNIGFLLTLDPTLVTPAYCSYVAGDMATATTSITGVGIDAVGNLYAAGTTTGEFPQAGTYGTAQYNTLVGTAASFTAQILNPATATAQLGYSVWISGNGADQPNALALDGTGNLYLFGQTTSSNLLQATTYTSTTASTPAGIASSANPISPAMPTKASTASTLSGFVAVINPSGQPQAVTYLGGDGNDVVLSGGVDTSGMIYAAGTSSSGQQLSYPAAPVLPTGQDSSTAEVQHGFLVQLPAALSAVNYVANFGGASGADGVVGVALDGSQDAYIAGNIAATSAAYTSYSAFQSATPSSTSSSAYVAEIASSTTSAQLTLTAAAHGTPDPIGFTTGTTETVSYTWTLTSAAAASPSNLVIQIPAQADLTYTSATLTGAAAETIPCNLSAAGASCLISSFPQGATGNDTLTLALSATLKDQPAGSSISVTASVFTPDSEVVSAVETSTVIVPAQLSIAASASSPANNTVFTTNTAASSPNTQVTYSFTLANAAGAGIATNAIFSLSASGSFVFSGVTGPDGTTCNDTGCTGLSIPAGSSVVVNVTGTYPDAALSGGASAPANTIFTTSLSGSLSTAQNTYTATTTLERGVHLVLGSSLSAMPASQTSFNLADSIMYTVKVTNNGPSTSSGADQLQVTLPVGFAATATPNFTCPTASPAVCTLSIAALASGGSASYTVTGSFPDNQGNANILATPVSETFSAAATLSGDFESATAGSDYSSQQSTSVYRTANVSITTSTFTAPATACKSATTCVYMQNSADFQDKVAYNIVVRNAGPDTSVGTNFTFALPIAPANPAGVAHPLVSGALIFVPGQPAFGSALTCTGTASGTQITCSGGNLPVGDTALTVSGSITADASTVPSTLAAVNTSASPGSITITQSANGTPPATTPTSLEIDRAAHLVTVKTVAATGSKPSMPINLEESNPGQPAGVNDLLTATLQIGNTPLNDAPNVVVTDTLPPYFKVTSAPAACTVNGAALSADYTTGSTSVLLSCALPNVPAGTATASNGGTAATVGAGAVTLSYSGKFVDNGAGADITSAGSSKQAQLMVNLLSAMSVTADAVDPVSPSDATSKAITVNVVRSVHTLLRKTRNTTVATAPATFADTTDPNLDEKTTTTRFGANDEIEYDVALANNGVNKALGVQFTDTLPPYFTVQAAYLISGAALTPDQGANSMPSPQVAGLVCYAGSAATGTPLVFPFSTGSSPTPFTCTYGTAASLLVLPPGTSQITSFDNATSVEVVYQGKYQDNAPGVDDIGAGVSTYPFTSAAKAASASASLAVDSAPNSGDNFSAALPTYNVQRAAHLRIFGTPTQTTTAESALTTGTTGPIIAEAEPSAAAGGTPVFNCLRYKVYVQNIGPNVSRQPQLTLGKPAGLNLTSSVNGVTSTPGTDVPLATSCSYGASIAPQLVSSSSLAPLSQAPNTTLVFDADGYFGLNTLTSANSQGGYALSYTALTDPGVMDSAKNAFSPVTDPALTVVNTPYGNNFTVVPFSTSGTRPTTITFGSVTTPGITTEQIAATGAALPSGTSADPRYGNMALYRTGTHPQFYSLATTAIPSAGTNATGVCVTSGTANTALADTFAKPERVLLWALANVPAGTTMNPVPHIAAVGDITTSVTPLSAANYVQASYASSLPLLGTAGSIPAVQSQPTQVCGSLNGFATAAAPVTLAVLEPVNLPPYYTSNAAQVSTNPGKGVSEVSFLFPNAYDFNDSDPCYVDSPTSRKTCNDNLVLTTWVFGAERLVPGLNHVVGPLAPAQAAAQGFLNSSVGLETQAGATYFEVAADQLGALAYSATLCDPGIASTGYTPVTNVTPCPVSVSSLTGTPPQVTDFGSAQVAELVPSQNGGSSGLILLPPAAVPLSASTTVASGYTAATATVTAGQTAGFEWDLLSIVPAGGTYTLSCYMVDAATLSVQTTMPTGLSCQVPASIAYNTPVSSGAPANPAIYIVTTGTLTAQAGRPAAPGASSWLSKSGVVLAGLLLPLLARRRKCDALRSVGLLTVLLVLGCAVGLSGCGSGSASGSAVTGTTPAGTYYFRVTATPVNGTGTLNSTAFSVKVLAGN